MNEAIESMSVEELELVQGGAEKQLTGEGLALAIFAETLKYGITSGVQLAGDVGSAFAKLFK